MNKILLILAASMLMGCASVTTANGGHYQTLGKAEIEHCRRWADSLGYSFEQCTKLHTDAFSGWKAIMDGASGAIVHIFTLGFFR